MIHTPLISTETEREKNYLNLRCKMISDVDTNGFPMPQSLTNTQTPLSHHKIPSN